MRQLSGYRDHDNGICPVGFQLVPTALGDLLRFGLECVEHGYLGTLGTYGYEPERPAAKSIFRDFPYSVNS